MHEPFELSVESTTHLSKCPSLYSHPKHSRGVR